MSEVIRVSIQRIYPVLEANCIGIAPQVTKVLHCYKPAIEKLVEGQLSLSDGA